MQANQSKYLDSCILSFMTSLNLGMPGSSQKGKDSLSQGRQEEMTSQNQANHFSTFFCFVLSLLQPRSGHKFGRQLIKCNFKNNISLQHSKNLICISVPKQNRKHHSYVHQRLQNRCPLSHQIQTRLLNRQDWKEHFCRAYHWSYATSLL